VEEIASKSEMTEAKEEDKEEIIEDQIRTTSDLPEILEALVPLAQRKEEKNDQHLEDQNERLVVLAENLFESRKIIRIKKAEWKNIKSMITMERLKILKNH
jgi:hypothetical protein